MIILARAPDLCWQAVEVLQTFIGADNAPITVIEIVQVSLLEEHKARLEALRRALIQGKQSGLADYSLTNVLDEPERED